MISFEHVTKRYGETVAVQDLSLEVPNGEIVVLVGPSGCGKTTALKMVNRLIEPSEGTIRVDGRDTRVQNGDQLRRSIGYVIQQVGLFPHLSIADNVATVPRLLGWSHERIRRRTEELLELVGLPAGEYGSRRPSELSGGQRQRVGVARALAADPPILLMDEPFGAIDPISRDRLQDELLHLQALLHKTIVFVTHDIDEAIKLADRIAIFRRGGQLEQYATPAEMLAHPGSTFVDQFLGRGRLVRRLGLIPLRSVSFASPETGTVPVSRIGIDDTLRDALDAVLSAPDGRAAVVDAGRVVGIVDADTIRRVSQ